MQITEHRHMSEDDARDPRIFPSSPVFSPTGREPGGDGTRFVTRSRIQLARKADLSGFLLLRHPELFISSGTSIYMKSHDSLYIRKGFPGYTDFSAGTHGNPIDFLTGYLGYGFIDAVTALTEGASCDVSGTVFETAHEDRRPVILPQSAGRPYRRVYAYLLGRGIPIEMTKVLDQRGILYQDQSHGNAVFVNPERDYCEIRGTLTYAQRPFHSCRKSRSDRFWYFSGNGKKPETAYLCESAIDAVSLFLLHHRKGLGKSAVYISIGGVYNQRTINRVKSRISSVLAVDNDPAGEACRQKNHDIPFLIPSAKDWNEDLKLLHS